MPCLIFSVSYHPVCTPSRMLRAIGASMLPLLITAGSYAASARFTSITTYPSGGNAHHRGEPEPCGVIASELERDLYSFIPGKIPGILASN